MVLRRMSAEQARSESMDSNDLTGKRFGNLLVLKKEDGMRDSFPAGLYGRKRQLRMNSGQPGKLPILMWKKNSGLSGLKVQLQS